MVEEWLQSRGNLRDKQRDRDWVRAGRMLLAGTPVMAANACHNHNNPAACRARRDVQRMRQENRALRQDIRAQNRYVRRNTPVYYPGVYNQPVYNPYVVAPAPGLTIRF